MGYVRRAVQPHAFVGFPWYLDEHPNSTWRASAIVVTVQPVQRDRNKVVLLCLTLGTAAWKLSPIAAVEPETWKRAMILTTPGRAAEV